MFILIVFGCSCMFDVIFSTSLSGKMERLKFHTLLFNYVPFTLNVMLLLAETPAASAVAAFLLFAVASLHDEIIKARHTAAKESRMSFFHV